MVNKIYKIGIVTDDIEGPNQMNLQLFNREK